MTITNAAADLSPLAAAKVRSAAAKAKRAADIDKTAEADSPEWGSSTSPLRAADDDYLHALGCAGSGWLI
jgi:hypothetical protein